MTIHVDEDCVAVRLRPGGLTGSDVTAGTGDVLDIELFPELIRQLLRNHASADIGRAAIVSAVAGHTPIVFAALSAAVPQAKDGKLRVLAVMSKNRSDGFPDAPTMAEAGFPGIDGDGWIGMFVPAGTPKNIIALLHGEVVQSMKLPDVKEQLAALGFNPVANTPELFEGQLRFELEKWDKVIRAANLQAQ